MGLDKDSKKWTKESILKQQIIEESEQGNPKHERFTLDEMLEIAQYGFDMAKESSETYVPIGNMLQHLMAQRNLILVPDSWIEFKHKGRPKIKNAFKS